MTDIEKTAINQAVALLEQAAIKEGQSLFSMVSDHAKATPDKLFFDYISEDECWTAAHLTSEIIQYIKESLQEAGWKAPE